MIRLSVFRVLALLFVVASPAGACEFLTDNGAGPAPVKLSGVEPGMAYGVLRCGHENFPGYLWTLGVDGEQAELGIRDDPLFDTETTGPIGRLAAVSVEDHTRLTVFERKETIGMPRAPLRDGRFSFRRFVTFCDKTGDDPLDCSLGKARIKAMSTAEDANRDGFLDTATHQISFYDGASRLHVLNFVTPWDESITADMGYWIEALNAVSDVLMPKKFASAD